MVINSPPMLMRLAHHEQTIYCWGYSTCYDLTVILDIPRMGGIIIMVMDDWRNGVDGTLNVPNPMSWILDMNE